MLLCVPDCAPSEAGRVSLRLARLQTGAFVRARGRWFRCWKGYGRDTVFRFAEGGISCVWGGETWRQSGREIRCQSCGETGYCRFLAQAGGGTRQGGRGKPSWREGGEHRWGTDRSRGLQQLRAGLTHGECVPVSSATRQRPRLFPWPDSPVPGVATRPSSATLSPASSTQSWFHRSPASNPLVPSGRPAAAGRPVLLMLCSLRTGLLSCT